MPSNSILFDVVSEDDFERIRMGRFNEAEERQLERLIMKKGGPRFHVFGRGTHLVDFVKPGCFSTRPCTKEGAHTFTFQYKTVSKSYRRDLCLDKRRYLRVDVPGRGKELRSAGAKYAKAVRVKGKRGGWWVPRGMPAPAGTSFADVADIIAEPTGEKSGSAARKQKYIEREWAVESLNASVALPASAGNIAGSCAERVAFWKALEKRERADGRVQNLIIAELPYEAEIGPIGRFEIVKRFGKELAEMGLRWHGVVHGPDIQSDPRNYHMHLVFSERPADPVGKGWRFASRKAPETRSLEFVPSLRAKFAQAVNIELEAAGIERRYDPRSYKEMGIEKQPGEHLGVAASALERKGVVTSNGQRNVAREMHFRLIKQLEAACEGLAADVQRIEPSIELVRRSDSYVSTRVHRASTNLADAVGQYVDAVEEHRRCEARAAVVFQNAADLQRRPKMASIYSDSEAVRHQAWGISVSLEKWMKGQTNIARNNLRNARRARARAESNLGRVEQNLVGETLIAERERALVRANRAVEKLTDNRASEEDWRGKRQSLVDRHSSAELVRDQRREALLSLLKPVGKSAANEMLAELENPRRKEKALEFLRTQPSIDFYQVDDDLSALVLALDELAAVKGEERRYRRIERSPDERRRRVRSNEEERELVQEVEKWAAEIQRIDHEILVDRRAFQLASQIGIATYIGEEAKMLEATLETLHSRPGERPKPLVEGAVQEDRAAKYKKDKSIHEVPTVSARPQQDIGGSEELVAPSDGFEIVNHTKEKSSQARRPRAKRGDRSR